MNFALKILAKVGKHLAKKMFGKKINNSHFLFGLLLGIAIFIFLVIIVIVAAYNLLLGVICRGIFIHIVDTCPKPLFDETKIETLADDMYYLRNITVDSSDGYAEKFREHSLKHEDLPEDERMNEAQMYLLVLEQLDTEVIAMYEDGDKRFEEGGEYEDSNYAKTLKKAKEKSDNIFNFKEVRNNLTDLRIEVWKCYLLGDCNRFSKEFIGDNAKNLLTETVRKTYEDAEGNKITETLVKNERLGVIFDNYYEISLYKGLKDGEEIFHIRLQEILEELEFFSLFPSQSQGKYGGGLSIGWNEPMEWGTYFQSSYFDEIRSWETTPHYAIDMASDGKGGVPIYATKSGVVVAIDTYNGYGPGILIDHRNGYFSFYAHMKMSDIVVKVGQEVQTGQLIAATGNEGKSTGPHLHFEICTKRWAPNPGLCDKSSRLDPEKEPFNIKFAQKSDLDYSLRDQRVREFPDMKRRALNGEIIIKPGVIDIGNISEDYWCIGGNKGCAPESFRVHFIQGMIELGIDDFEEVKGLVYIYGMESTWNPTAKNPSSSAYGYAQFLSSTMKEYKKMYPEYDYNDPVHQTILGYYYAVNRYGSPNNAAETWKQQRWW